MWSANESIALSLSCCCWDKRHTGSGLLSPALAYQQEVLSPQDLKASPYLHRVREFEAMQRCVWGRGSVGSPVRGQAAMLSLHSRAIERSNAGGWGGRLKHMLFLDQAMDRTHANHRGSQGRNLKAPMMRITGDAWVASARLTGTSLVDTWKGCPVP